ncbi:MAG: hypothetical protein Q4E24_02085 [bacterium]|nr:hypothetical protein [bacterium]
MKEKDDSVQQVKILNELIENAMGLPIESQNLLLILAKGMAYTRDCLVKQNTAEQSLTSVDEPETKE